VRLSKALRTAGPKQANIMLLINKFAIYQKKSKQANIMLLLLLPTGTRSFLTDLSTEEPISTPFQKWW